MCVICIKLVGCDFPPESAIKNCIRKNRDGFSMAWNENGLLRTFRTMDPDEAVEKYREVSRLNPRTTGLIFHARIATHGSLKLENCHCWDYDGKYAFAHNGVLRNIKVYDDKTDSEVFFRDLLVPAIENVGKEYAFRIASAVIGDTRNKIALIDANGHIDLFGEYLKQGYPGRVGKIYFSNSSFMETSSYGVDAAAMAYASRPVPKLPTAKAIKETTGKKGGNGRDINELERRYAELAKGNTLF